MATATKPAFFFQFKNILFTTDFSACSEAALPVAYALAVRFGAVLHLVHVLPSLEVAALDQIPDLRIYDRAAELQMANLLLRHPLKGVSYEIAIERGALWDVLEDAVASREIDLIVLGTRGRGGLAKLVLGSAAEQIFRRAACPVLTVGPHVRDNTAEGVMKTILYATDFSSGSLFSLQYAVALSHETKAQLRLLHVLTVALPSASEEEINRITETCRERLLALLPPVAGLACPPEAMVLFGAAAEGILRAARECQAGLIVMGANLLSRGMANVHLPWATAHRVVCEAPCPVLTVRY